MQRLPDRDHGALVTLRFEGRKVEACAGESVAAALFASGERVLSRSIKYHRPRGFFCLDGSCVGCLMRIDGKPNQKACRTLVADGMEIERQNAWPSAGLDLLGAADFFFPHGMDHHTLLVKPRALNAMMQKVVRQLGGLGRLPDEKPLQLPPAKSRNVETVVVGGGPAGLGAATAAARAGKQVLLVEEQELVGGSTLAHPAFGPAWAARAADDARAAGVEILTGAVAIGWYPEDEGGILAVAGREGLLKLSAKKFVYATGAYDQNALFADNDRPGVLSARAVGRLLVRFGILPGKQPIVVGSGPYAQALGDALEKVGAQVTRVDGVDTRVIAAKGRSWVTGLEVEENSKQRVLKCDLVAIAALPAPASELPRMHGAGVEFREAGGGFCCVTDERGHTSVENVLACGDVTGMLGVERAFESGQKVAT